MKPIGTLILIAILLCSSAVLAQQDNTQVLQAFDAYLDETASQLGDSPFAAVVSKDGKIIYERYYDGQGVLGHAVNRQSRWQVFSITKSFISALVLGLCEEGVLGLDEPVSKYLPDFNEHGDGAFDRRDVTIRHLLSHTSGAAVDGNKVPDSLPPGFGQIAIISAPGTDFEYSGLGMLILERVLEAATGKDLGVVLDERIIVPLGLGLTGYVYPGSTSDRILPLTEGMFQFSQNGHRAGAGLYTSARDLNAFGRFWLNPEAMFSNELREQAWTFHGMRASDQGRYGLMWWLFEDDGGYVMSGRQSKINAVIPETGVVITVIRYPQEKASGDYRYIEDKRAMVRFGRRMK